MASGCQVVDCLKCAATSYVYWQHALRCFNENSAETGLSSCKKCMDQRFMWRPSPHCKKLCRDNKETKCWQRVPRCHMGGDVKVDARSVSLKPQEVYCFESRSSSFFLSSINFRRQAYTSIQNLERQETFVCWRHHHLSEKYFCRVVAWIKTEDTRHLHDYLLSQLT